MKDRTIGLVVMALVALVAARADAGLISYKVTDAYATLTSSPGEIYSTASITVDIDPSVTNWIAWNDTPTLSLSDGGCGGFVGGSGSCLGPGGFGTNDSIDVTVTNPDGAAQTETIDENSDWGVSSGTQNVLFGTAEDAPDVYRETPVWYPSWLTGAGASYFDEAGALNAIFTGAGSYQFDFSFVNDFQHQANHPDIYLLVYTTPLAISSAGDCVLDCPPPPPPDCEVDCYDGPSQTGEQVPEPALLLLAGVGALGLAGRLRRRIATRR